MHNQRVGLAIAYGIGTLGCFLPWAHVPIVGTISGTQGNGMIALVLYGLCLGSVFIGVRSEPQGRALTWVARALGLVGSAVGCWTWYSFQEKFSAMADDSNPFVSAMAAAVGLDLGIYVVCFAGVVAIPVGIFTSRGPSVAMAQSS